MNDVFVTCIKNGRVDQFGRPLVNEASYTLSWNLARDLWLSGYVSVTDASIFDASSVDVRRPNLAAELAAITPVPININKWKSAEGKAIAGVRNAKLLIIGDSTTLGAGSTGSPGYLANGVSTAFPQLLANLFARSGLPVTANGMLGVGLSTVAEINTFNPRIVAHSTWVPTALANSIGGWQFRNATPSQTLAFTPSVPVDTFEVIYIQNQAGAGTFSLDINGSAEETVNGNASPASAVTKVKTTTLGTNTLNIKFVSGGSTYILGLRAYNSAQKCVEIIVGAASGQRAIDLITPETAVNVWRAQNLIQNVIAPDLTIINLGINDATQDVGVSAFSTAYAALIDSALLSGDVLCITPYPIANISVEAQAPYFDAVKTVAADKGVNVVDVNALFGTYDEMNALGCYSNTSHPNGAGYGMAADEVRKWLLS